MLLVASPTLALAEKNYDQAKADLLAAFEKSSIQKEGSPPFELTVNFMLTFDAPVSGTYKLNWMSPSVWRLDINMPGYQEKKVRDEDKEWTDRNLKFPPLRVQQLDHLFKDGSPFQPDAPFDATIEGIQDEKDEVGGHISCMKVSQHGSKSESRTYCLDSMQRLVKIKSRTFENLEQVEVYSDFAQFNGKEYARKRQVLFGGKLIVDASVRHLDSTVPAAGLFLGLPAVPVRQVCDHRIAPKPLSTADPTYSESARKSKIQGFTTLYVTVEADGHVSDASVIETLEPSLDKNAIEAVKRWKFKPAMCGTTPIPVDISVQIHFRLN